MSWSNSWGGMFCAYWYFIVAGAKTDGNGTELNSKTNHQQHPPLELTERSEVGAPKHLLRPKSAQPKRSAVYDADEARGRKQEL